MDRKSSHYRTDGSLKPTRVRELKKGCAEAMEELPDDLSRSASQVFEAGVFLVRRALRRSKRQFDLPS